MLNTKSFLAVDFGAGSLKLAEFRVNEAGGLSLINYGIESLGLEGAAQEAGPREAIILKAVQKLEAAKLKLEVADVSPAALCNAFRYNYGDLEDCTMLLDIGAKTSNLLFFEKGKVFSRSINLGANAITQDFMQEAKLKFDNAEKIK